MAGSGTSLMVQWLRLHILNAGTPSLIPGWETGSTDHNYKILHAATKIWCSQKKKKKWLMIQRFYLKMWFLIIWRSRLRSQVKLFVLNGKK